MKIWKKQKGAILNEEFALILDEDEFDKKE